MLVGYTIKIYLQHNTKCNFSSQRVDTKMHGCPHPPLSVPELFCPNGYQMIPTCFCGSTNVCMSLYPSATGTTILFCLYFDIIKLIPTNMQDMLAVEGHTFNTFKIFLYYIRNVFVVFLLFFTVFVQKASILETPVCYCEWIILNTK